MSVMRWSWESFAAGLTGGALLGGLLWAALGETRDNVDLFSEAELTRNAQPTEPEADTPPVPSVASARTGGRRHVSLEARTPTEDAPPPVADWGAAAIRSGRISIGQGISNGQAIRISFSGGDNGWIQVLTGATGGDAAPALLKWATKRGRELFPDDPVGRGEAATRLGARSYADRAAGLGLATRVDPVPLDLLLSAARDTGYPDLRGAALLAAAERAIDDEDVRAAILEMALDGDSGTRRTATSLLEKLGAEGAGRAAQILLSGDYTPEIVGQLTGPIARHGDVGAFLGASPPPDAALSVIQQLASRLEDPQTDSDRRLAEALPQLVRPLLESPAADEYAAAVFGQLVALGHGAFLRGIATTPIYSDAVRGSAVQSALQDDRTRADGISAAAALLTDPTVDVALAQAVLGAIRDDEWLDDGTLRGALEAAARGHPSAWVRDAARDRLTKHDPSARGAIVIHEAKYGSGDGWLDVADRLRGAISGGALRVQATNELGGDPRVGAQKTLRVEYSLGGERRLKTVGEGAWLTIP